MLKDRQALNFSGWHVLIISIALLAICGSGIWLGISADQTYLKLICGLFALVILGNLAGLFIMDPNEATALLLFGNYIGTVKTPGLRWSWPFFSKRSVILRIRNFESSKLKVNDLHGSPIEIAAVIVWKVENIEKALFDVYNYENFVTIQSEAAIRNLAMRYAYDAHDTAHLSLLGDTQKIAEQLKIEVQKAIAHAGVQVLEAKISHLAYAPEIAVSMLQRQQAQAVLAARQIIVEGAVGMVEMALKKLSASHIVELDEEKKASMVSNLLVVLCSEKNTQPIINTGTLY